MEKYKSHECLARARGIRYLCAMSTILLVYCTCPDRKIALELARHLVEQGLAACVGISAPQTSVYLWKGKLETEQECQLTIKTTVDRYQDLEDALRTRHPYELPEIIAVPIQHGLPEYLQWVEQCTNSFA